MHLRKQSFRIVSTWAALACLLYGCAPKADSRPDRGPDTPPRDVTVTRQPWKPGKPVVIQSRPEDQQAMGIIDARPAALINGRALDWSELRSILNEAAGAQALQEAILDRKIDEALASRGILVTDDDIAAERKALLESLNADANVAMRLLDELRDRQNLGKVRFDDLMRRNAGLRALVRHQVKVTPAAVEAMYDIVHGPKRQARLLTTQDLATAQGAINLVNSGVSFADVAVEMSTDYSAARGGLLEPIARSDPSYPEAIRAALWSLNIGEMSSPILLDKGYAVVLLVKRLAPGSVTLEEARPAMERLVRTSQERLLMDQQARNMLADTSVTIFDEQLNEAWSRARKSGK
jgi:parvulin-like peptidyl-prolyl isomerase